MLIELNGEIIDSTTVIDITRSKPNKQYSTVNLDKYKDKLKEDEKAFEECRKEGKVLTSEIDSIINSRFKSFWNRMFNNKYLIELNTKGGKLMFHSAALKCQIHTVKRVIAEIETPTTYSFKVITSKDTFKSKEYNTKEEANYVRQYVVNTINGANPISIQF